MTGRLLLVDRQGRKPLRNPKNASRILLLCDSSLLARILIGHALAAAPVPRDSKMDIALCVGNQRFHLPQ